MANMIGKSIGVAGIVACLVVGTSSAQAQLFGNNEDKTAQNTARLVQLEDQVRTLTGQVEELTYQLRMLEDKLRRAQEDNEYRIQQLENSNGIASGAVPLPQSGAAPAKQGQTPASAAAAQDTAQGTGGGPLDLSSLGAPGALDTTKTSGEGTILVGDVTNSTPVAGAAEFAGKSFMGDVNTLLTGDAQADYNVIYGLLVDGNYTAAAKGFDIYIGMYPDFELAPSAQHWLGESYLAQRDYKRAAEAFLTSFRDYPESELAPESLLKLGVSLVGLGSNDTACATFSEVIEVFPYANPSVLEQAKTEQKKLSCK
ncbi:tol-pal system protein YbgF [Polycladidibacter hongkongensis]|uniref:tol-pal system protein YbgF n=1 Tax=Polycladidibacter hongkongensis TaxID=1647556 RepID=UPI0008326136|nr:tol-pal system protein YbgF [Pseudovibrio hongkongensis]